MEREGETYKITVSLSVRLFNLSACGGYKIPSEIISEEICKTGCPTS